MKLQKLAKELRVTLEWISLLSISIIGIYLIYKFAYFLIPLLVCAALIKYIIKDLDAPQK